MDSFGAAAELRVRDRRYAMYRLAALERHGFGISRLPYSLRILLENLLRTENGSSVTRNDIEALAGWRAELARTHRDRVSARPRSAAGFHRRSRDRRSRGDARRHGPARRRSRQNQSAAAGRIGDRPFDPGRRLRGSGGHGGSTSGSTTAATASATPSSNGASRPSRISAWRRPTAASATRSTSNISPA